MISGSCLAPIQPEMMGGGGSARLQENRAAERIFSEAATPGPLLEGRGAAATPPCSCQIPPVDVSELMCRGCWGCARCASPPSLFAAG